MPGDIPSGVLKAKDGRRIALEFEIKETIAPNSGGARHFFGCRNITVVELAPVSFPTQEATTEQRNLHRFRTLGFQMTESNCSAQAVLWHESSVQDHFALS